MKPHFKKNKNGWLVFQSKEDKTHIMCVPGSLWAASIEWKHWVRLQELLNSKPV